MPRRAAQERAYGQSSLLQARRGCTETGKSGREALRQSPDHRRRESTPPRRRRRRARPGCCPPTPRDGLRVWSGAVLHKDLGSDWLFVLHQSSLPLHDRTERTSTHSYSVGYILLGSGPLTRELAARALDDHAIDGCRPSPLPSKRTPRRRLSGGQLWPITRVGAYHMWFPVPC